MAYIRKTYRFRNAVEIEEYHSARYGAPGMSRRVKNNTSPEDMERLNQWKREKKCRHKLRWYFNLNDYYVTLTYRKDERPPGMEAAKKHFSEFIRKLKRQYKKQNIEMHWIRNIEVGTRDGWHIHMAINRIPDLDILISRFWTHGRAIWEGLHKHREFAKLAAYMVKTPKTDPRLRETSYSASRNMPLPEPEKKVYRSKTWKAEPIVEDGWYLDKESYVEGINPVTGYPYRHYTKIRTMRC